MQALFHQTDQTLLAQCQYKCRKFQEIFFPPESSTQKKQPISYRTTSHASTNLATRLSRPATDRSATHQLSTRIAAIEALQQILLKTAKRARKSANYFGFDNDDSSGKSQKFLSSDLMQPKRKRRVGDIEKVTAALFEPVFNQYPSPVIAEVLPTDPRIRPTRSQPRLKFIHL